MLFGHCYYNYNVMRRKQSNPLFAALCRPVCEHSALKPHSSVKALLSVYANTLVCVCGCVELYLGTGSF